MKRILALLLGVLFLVGCSSSQPKAPLAGKYKFESISYTHVQRHEPTKFFYQSPKMIEKKYNKQILEGLTKANLLDQNSSDELKIKVTHRREFIGEATFAKSDRMGNIYLTYEVEVVRNGEILRRDSIGESRYDPGFFGNLKGIVGQNNDDSLENKAISANVKEIVDTIKGMK
ncbi:hypothetical protein [Campylobacter concisus]|uniref:Lipoprotein n=1 Tax=Campylobacter concisus TaxID=199 RepID=A0A7S9X6B1_9BACT|nr:hypothetical protein [Campylobacter concisus]QPI06088.1 hypothetical protein G5B96_01595 [Campylobacter concisus]